MATLPTDESVVDAIATLLGTQPEWNGADCLEQIANLIGGVRPHPGNTYGRGYAATFAETTGRQVDPRYDWSA